MAIEIIKKENQVLGNFNHGEIIEYKPIGFPQEIGGIKAYSNLFYWAYAKSSEKSKIGLHPHKGFEIMTIVIKGGVNHYDTKNEKWIALEEGAAQVINAGSGISHSEELIKDAEIFQIWFDPNLAKSLAMDASYKDFRATAFIEVKLKVGSYKTNIAGKTAPILLNTEKVEFTKYRLENTLELKLDSKSVYGLFLYSGNIIVNNSISVENKDFLKIDAEKVLHLQTKKPAVIYLMKTPLKTSYNTYI